jgi:tetratricopeptide (TPR) repeat protein
MASVAAAGAAPADACTGQQNCVRASAAQLFAAADQLAASGDLAGAAQLLQALTQDPHPELRAEARFRLAAVREKMGDLEGAAQTLRDLLAEQPSANPARLELARILGRMGNAKAAEEQIAEAQAWGIPQDVQQNVRRFASTLTATKRRGLTIEATAGPDSNINRSTASQFIDTIIAPFELDKDARRQAGIGATLTAQGYIRNSLGGVDLLSRGGVRADLYDVARFSDVQLSLDSGPDLPLGRVHLRPSTLYERRWFGGSLFATGFGANLNFTAPLSARSQLELNGSRVRQNIKPNPAQDGWRTALTADLYEALWQRTTARFTARYGRLDARVTPESLRQFGGGLLLAQDSPGATLFGEVDYTWTHGIAPQFLFGKIRRDHRWDLTGGVIFKSRKFGGFSPLVRVTHSESRANILLYDYRRTRLDVGFTRSF